MKQSFFYALFDIFFLFMQCDYGKFILKQLDFSPSFSTRDSHLGCSYNTRARSLIVAVAPKGKASFVYSYVQTRLMGQYNGKWPISVVYVLKPLITAIRAIVIGLVKIYFVPFWQLRAICISEELEQSKTCGASKI